MFSIQRHNRRRPGPVRLRDLAVESLEVRLLLTSTLYIDYGDLFPGGALVTTVGALDTTVSGANPDMDGPILSNSAGANYAAGTAVTINSVNSLYSAGAAATLRDTMTALTQRLYQGLDITVVELSAAPQNVNGNMVQSAASLADISVTLGLNEGAAENNDSYIIVGQFLIGASNDNPATFATNGYGGLSTGTDIGGNNNNDGTALVCLIGAGDSATFNGAQIAHEAGHAFGLRHVFRQNTGSPPPLGPAVDSQHQAEVMSYLGYNSQGGFNVFSRYPMMLGNGNINPNTLSASPTPFDAMANDPNIGPSGISYVTGTGADDIITIVKTGANQALVSITAFTDSTYATAIDVPGPTGDTFTFNVSLDQPLLIDAGGRNDRISIDGDLGVAVTLRGMHGTDQLIVLGKNAGTATYTTGSNSADGLDNNSDLQGTFTIGSTTIQFQEFETVGTVTLQDVGTLNYQTSLGDDELSIISPVVGQGQITGSTGGVNLVPLRFFNIGTVNVDAGFGDGGGASDEISIGNLTAAGLSDLNIETAGGSDRLIVTGLNALPGNITFDGQDGDDTVEGADSPTTWLVSGFESGSVPSYDLSFSDVENLEGGAAVDTFELGIASLNVSIDGRSGNDQIIGPNDDRTWTLTGFESGNVTVSNVSFADVETLVGGSAVDSFFVVIGGSGYSIDGGPASDFIVGPNVPNIWSVNGLNAGLLSPNTLDFVNVENLTGGTSSDQFDFQAFGALSGQIDGGPGHDVMDFSVLGSVKTVLSGLGSSGGANGFDGIVGGGSPVGGGFANMDRVIGSLGGTFDELVGINGPAVWTYTTSLGTYLFQTRTFEFSNQEILTGGTLIDRFTVAPLTSAPLFINGGLPTTLPGDLLRVNLVGVSNPQLIVISPGNGLFTFDPPHQTIFYSSIERLDVFDYGDAPVSFGTTTVSGARHRLGSNLKLGLFLDPESNGQPSGLANKDDSTGTPDDEDGVVLPTNLVAEFRAALIVNASAAARLDAWIDFNANGAFDSGEKIVDDVPMVAGNNRIEFQVPGWAVAGNRHVRFRLSTVGGLGPTGQAEDGEVEDYVVKLMVLTPGTAVVLDDPLAPGESKNMLFVAGSSGKDEIIVEPFFNDSVRVVLTGHPIFGPTILTPVSRIGVLGGADNDRIIINADLTLPAEIYSGYGNDLIFSAQGDDFVDGGTGNDVVYAYNGKDIIYGQLGNDVLYGMGGADIVLGGGDNDFLYGGAGRDLLIGGLGSDQAFGETGDDLLIGATTSFDSDWVALRTLHSEWYSGRTYSARTLNIRTGAGPVLGGTSLTLAAGSTVADDSSDDSLFGGSDRDWFFQLSADDTSFDWQPDEAID